ncbi:hypothetical protein CPC08DRAFT_820877 [Agrocybe pediades]|nr:hypothetical protein CPC08DRAFT_820877 [Agrocybe pediades]
MYHPHRSFSASMPAQDASPPDPLVVHPLRCQAKLSSLAHNLGSLSTFVHTAEELLFLSTLPNFNFPLNQKRVIALIEIARHTLLMSAGLVLYQWASCPKAFVAHKQVYMDLLKILQIHQSSVDNQNLRRLRVLLMPLTSRFIISKSGDGKHSSFDASTSCSPPPCSSVTTDSQHHASTPEEASLSTMPPPDGFSRAPASSSETPYRRPRTRRLWHVSELSYMSGARKYGARTRSPQRSSSSSLSRAHEDVNLDQENVAPQAVPFRQAPRTQRFGIFMSRKPSMLGSYKRGSRDARPTH